MHEDALLQQGNPDVSLSVLNDAVHLGLGKVCLVGEEWLVGRLPGSDVVAYDAVTVTSYVEHVVACGAEFFDVRPVDAWYACEVAASAVHDVYPVVECGEVYVAVSVLGDVLGAEGGDVGEAGGESAVLFEAEQFEVLCDDPYASAAVLLGGVYVLIFVEWGECESFTFGIIRGCLHDAVA